MGVSVRVRVRVRVRVKPDLAALEHEAHHGVALLVRLGLLVDHLEEPDEDLDHRKYERAERHAAEVVAQYVVEHRADDPVGLVRARVRLRLRLRIRLRLRLRLKLRIRLRFKLRLVLVQACPHTSTYSAT